MAIKIKIGFIMVMLLVNFSLLANNGTPYSFIRLNASDGLVNNQVTCIFKDSRGFIWIGTSSGISRYDGVNFVNYIHNDNDKSSIIDNYITQIQEDKEGNLWIGTRWEYTIFDFNKEVFIKLSDILKLKGITQQISKVYIDKNKDIWFKPINVNRYFVYNKEKSNLINPFESTVGSNVGISDFYHDGDNFYLLYDNGTIECYNGNTHRLLFCNKYLNDLIDPANFYTSIFVDGESDLWVYGNTDGIFHYQMALKQWSHYTTSSNEIKLSSNLVRKIIQDDKGLIWIGTDHGGIDIINKFSKDVKTVYYQAENLKSLSQNSITDIFIDDNNILWIGTFKKGLCYYHESIHKFQHYHNILSDKNSLPFSDVNCFVEDKKGNLWIGSNGGGLIYFDRINNKYSVYKNELNNVNSLSNNVVVSLYIDNEGLLWIGTFTGGINTYDGRSFTRYKTGKVNGLTNDNIWNITQDSRNRIWIGTLGGGIVLFDKNKKSFIPLPNYGNTQLPSLYVNQIYRMHNGNMFIATGVGVVFYDINENRFRNHPYNNRNIPLNLSNNNVNWVFEDSRGLLWVASREGLTMIDPNTDYTKIFRKEDGLERDVMNCIQEDQFHSIWVSKSNGLSKIDVNDRKAGDDYTFTIHHFTEADGLQGQEFNANSSFKTSKGELIFGGPNGFNIFQTKNIRFNKNLPKVVFTDFQIFNKSVKVGEKINNRVILKNGIYSTNHIVINHSMNVFSIEFVALNSFIPGKLKYKYQLEGFDKDWIEVDGNTRKVVYTNLNAGTYNFKVKACNSDGAWNEGYTKLQITVLPPFFASPIAYVLYFILIVLILIYYRYSMLKKERFKFKMEQERLFARRNHELDEMKLRFLTNVSHEFRTPLTLILTPIEKLLKTDRENSEKKLLETINRNARNLLDLVNQLLDFRKLDLYGLKYNPKYGDIITFLKTVCDNFNDSFQRKGVQLEFKTKLNELFFEFDSDKFQKVMMNLISNAFKFTPSGGTVQVSAELGETDGSDNQIIIIRVKDSGVGIRENEIEKIFDRFYQSQNNVSLGISGSGIGLNLAKEMVALHSGIITVESEPGKGSEFIIKMPINFSFDNEIEEISEENINVENGLKIPKFQIDRTKPSILLIEDNFEFRIFMKESLEDHYTVYEAADGVEGYEMVDKIIPDLIISDVMMPRMDGLEMCRKLKSDIRTSHIPFIILTARTADEDKIQGLEIGADDYITKPFNMELLLLRIQNLMEKRKNLHDKFKKNIDFASSELEIPSMDEKLIKKAIAYVNKNIAESGLSVEDLSRELGMSRVYLYKKLLAITGKSPVELIRIIRLKHGSQLLEKSQMSVSEVAYAVGFNSPRYFSKYFHDEYGMLPKDYTKKFRKSSTDKIDID